MFDQLFKEKKVVMSLKIDESLKKAFQKICLENETTPSQEVRKFIKAYIQKTEQIEIDFGD